MIQEMQQIDLGQIQTMLSIAEQLEMKEDVKEDKEVRDVAGGQQQAMATMQSKQQPQQPQQTSRIKFNFYNNKPKEVFPWHQQKQASKLSLIRTTCAICHKM
jgi:hypothetical protein